ncbi:hypothetical protein HYV88_02585 [Candidatus Woesearchaeota archaeon]|nr:hypothetical protein [Candidatus Woesearchaeota archaeon]
MGRYAINLAGSPNSNREISQEATFTHKYSQSGNYKVVFTVTDDKGASAQSSISVNVGSGSDNGQEFSLEEGETKVFREEGIKVRLKDILIMAVDYANKLGKNEYSVEVEIIDSASKVVLYEIKTLRIGDEVEIFNNGRLKLIDIQTIKTIPVQYVAVFGIKFENQPIACSACMNGKPTGEYDQDGCMIFECPPIVNDEISKLLITDEKFGNDVFDLKEVSINGDILSVIASYGGGCKGHKFTLTWDGGFMKSVPPQSNLFLYHNSNGDSCEAYITQTFNFDLTPLKNRYQDLYSRNDKIIIRLNSINGDIRMVTYEPQTEPSESFCVVNGECETQFGENEMNCPEDCKEQKECPQLGYREKGRYCNINNAWEEQLNGGEYCNNNFECSSNSCLDSQCTEPGFWIKISEWLSKIFSLKA